MTADVALYGHWICPFATRVQFALHERGIPYELVDVPPSGVRSRDFEFPPEFVEHSPRLEIPMVRVGDRYLADSIPVLEWLEVEIAGRSLLPGDDEARSMVRERMAWIDRHAFRPMIGVYYGIEPERIARAGELLADALAEMGRWADETGWLAGDVPSLAEAVVIPIHVRMEGLRRLGFTDEVPAPFERHGERCRSLAGWPGVEWSPGQTDEFVGRLTAYRRKHGY